MSKFVQSLDSINRLFICQSQKEELDSALKAVAASGDEKGKADLEEENTKLKEELSSLPELKKELEILRARVTELNQLTGIARRFCCCVLHFFNFYLNVIMQAFF